jgi:lysophospholipase L1-like esterase
MALAADEGCGFLDLEGAWGAYLRSVAQPYAWFMRDEVHANTRGAQLLARILERWFAPDR